MERRHFLLGASALGLTACAQPERSLLDEWADNELELVPGGPRTPSTTTTAAPVGDSDTVAPAEENSPYPFDIPPEDLPGLSFVAEAIVSTVAAVSYTHLTLPTIVDV